jgi:hypothetical protein
MKTSKLHLLAIAFFIGLSFTACKKSDSSTDNTLKDNATVNSSQDAESQDAQADNLDQSIDNIGDALEANNFSAVKSTQVGGPSVTVDHPDTITFPKVITLVFATDTTINGEKFKQSGTIVITVERTKDVGSWKNYLKRTINISNFKTENDSASFTVNGTRTMIRKEIKVTPLITTLEAYKTATSLRIAVLDSIKSEFAFTITCGTFTKNFTRVVKRTRQALAHFEKASGGLIWHQALLKDTMILKGSVTGKNLMDSTYTRTISETDPITVTRCALLVPVISSGKLTITRATPKGTKEGVITYSKDACKTVVTLTVGDKTKVIERKLNRVYKKWW